MSVRTYGITHVKVNMLITTLAKTTFTSRQIRHSSQISTDYPDIKIDVFLETVQIFSQGIS
jgi:hypothetical protein